MVICEWCGQGCHLACHDPPLTEVPEDDEWYCPKCRPIVPKHPIAVKLRAEFAADRAAAGVSDEDMLEATTALIERGSAALDEDMPEASATPAERSPAALAEAQEAADTCYADGASPMEQDDDAAAAASPQEAAASPLAAQQAAAPAPADVPMADAGVAAGGAEVAEAGEAGAAASEPGVGPLLTQRVRCFSTCCRLPRSCLSHSAGRQQRPRQTCVCVCVLQQRQGLSTGLASCVCVCVAAETWHLDRRFQLGEFEQEGDTHSEQGSNTDARRHVCRRRARQW